MRVHGTAQLQASMALQYQPKTARNPSKKKKKEEKEPKNLRSVNTNENHLFTVHRLGWKETVARELQEKKGDLPI